MERKFKKLIEQHQHRIYTFAYYCLGNHEEAEDVTQEVLLRLWKNWQRVDPARLVPWLMRVTKNACIDASRKRRKYRTIIQGDKDGEAVERAVSCDMNPEAAAEFSDFHKHLQRILRSLPEPYRTIVILREIQDMKYEQICEALNLPLNTMKVYLHRGRQLLRIKMKEVVGYETNS
jgi:RNA polymerase sigma-70 factor (ECF subfamily)